MRTRQTKSISIRGPIILCSVILVLILMLTVLWNVALVHDYQRFRDMALETASFHWTLIAVGSSLFLAIIVLASVLGAQLISRTRRSQRQSSFVASVTHELNSPLSVVKLFAQTLRGPDLSEADRLRFVTRILSEVDRLSRIVGNILRAAEVDNRGDKLPVVPSTVHLHAFIGEYIEEARAVRGDSVTLGVSGDEAATVEIDPAMFRQVLNNLVDNAVRHGHRKPIHVEFSVSSADHVVELCAQDNGVGIPKGELKSIFRPFSKLEKSGTHPPTGGMGIGLFVVRSIVEAHGGQVGARSQEGEAGATIWIRLPCTATPERME